MTPTVGEIQNAVCESFGVPLVAMLTQRRDKVWSYPRQIAMALSSEMTELSLASIARLFGDRDHSTVVHAARTVKLRCDADAALADKVNATRRGAIAVAEVRLAKMRERAAQAVAQPRVTGLANEPKNVERTDRMERVAKVDGCRRLLIAHLTTGQHWLRDREEVRRLLAA